MRCQISNFFFDFYFFNLKKWLNNACSWLACHEQTETDDLTHFQQFRKFSPNTTHFLTKTRLSLSLFRTHVLSLSLSFSRFCGLSVFVPTVAVSRTRLGGSAASCLPINCRTKKITSLLFYNHLQHKKSSHLDDGKGKRKGGKRVDQPFGKKLMFRARALKKEEIVFCIPPNSKTQIFEGGAVSAKIFWNASNLKIDAGKAPPMKQICTIEY